MDAVWGFFRGDELISGAGTTLLKHSMGELLKVWQRPPSPNV
ncbi:hypothetical protein XOCgx_3180 [Xanthomonas oryzae pv. oryzicola]|nr:hypothetical protein XOCgx_3180 [Xanthomonas oryzae pv. oryzicola]